MAEIKITFRGEDFVIPETRAFEAGDRIEDFVARRVPDRAPLFEVLSWPSRPRYHLIAGCIAILLQLAGKAATAEEVHAEMMARVKDGVPVAHSAAVASLIELLMHGAPPPNGDQPEKPDAS